MADLPTLVCPRCSTGVGEHAWCPGCGLNLRQWPPVDSALDFSDLMASSRDEAPPARTEVTRALAPSYVDPPTARHGAARARPAPHADSAPRRSRLSFALVGVTLLAVGLVAGVLIAVLNAQRSGGAGDAERTAGDGADAASATTRDEPLSSDSTLTTTGLGPVLVGMTPERAEQAAETTFTREQSNSTDCYYVRPANLAGVSFMIVNGVVARIDVTEPNVATQSGVRVGAGESDLRETYGAQLQETDNLYEPDEPDLIFVPRDSADPTRMLFGMENGVAESIYAGRGPEVKAPEGCL